MSRRLWKRTYCGTITTGRTFGGPTEITRAWMSRDKWIDHSVKLVGHCLCQHNGNYEPNCPACVELSHHIVNSISTHVDIALKIC